MAENKIDKVELINIGDRKSPYREDDIALKINQFNVIRNYFLSKNINVLNVNDIRFIPNSDKGKENKMYFKATVTICSENIDINPNVLAFEEFWERYNNAMKL